MQKNKYLLNNNSFSKKNKEFNIFFNKFIGYLTYRGKKSKAFKNFDNIIYMIKKNYKYYNIINIIYIFYLKLYPIFSVRYKRFGKNYQAIPKLAVGNIKNVLIFNWFLKALKGKNNVQGIKLEDIVDNIINTSKKKRSSALLNKTNFYKRVLLGKHLLKNVNRRKGRRKFRTRSWEN